MGLDVSTDAPCDEWLSVLQSIQSAPIDWIRSDPCPCGRREGRGCCSLQLLGTTEKSGRGARTRRPHGSNASRFRWRQSASIETTDSLRCHALLSLDQAHLRERSAQSEFDFNAEDVSLNSGTEFVVRLFRSVNANGFVHAISDKPISFASGLTKVVMQREAFANKCVRFRSPGSCGNCIFDRCVLGTDIIEQ